MKVAIVLIAALASAHAGVRVVRQSGWPAPTTPGWAPPPTTAGWPAPAPSAGWAPGGLTNIDLNAALAAAGSGWAGESHQEAVTSIGAGGWGPNAEIVISAGGEALVDGAGSILQVTSQDQQSASSLNNAAVSQIAEGAEGESVDALGVEITNQQSGWASSNGEGASAVDASSLLNVNPAAALGMAKP